VIFEEVGCDFSLVLNRKGTPREHSEIPRKSHFSGEHPIVDYLMKGLNR
jgi:hypothetical protein